MLRAVITLARDYATRVGFLYSGNFFQFYRDNLDMHIDPVKQRTRNFG